MVTRRATTAEAAPRRKKLAAATEAAASFFANLEKEHTFLSSGCTMFDAILGGGYVLGRIVNLVGDRSTGKTLQAIEAFANFAVTYPDGKARYCEAESAFDDDYAQALGLPLDFISRTKDGEVRTVQHFYNDLEKFLKDLDGKPGIYVLDSLDALSEDGELERNIDDGSYGAEKAKKLGELFRRLTAKLEKSKCLLIIISQIRDKIGVTFGKQYSRSGGKALDFYASHIIWLADLGKIKKTIRGQERVIGINVKAKCTKNKVGLPFREATYPIIFGYGTDDLYSSVEWLLQFTEAQDFLDEFGLTKSNFKTMTADIRNSDDRDHVRNFRKRIRAEVFRVWAIIETQFLPKKGKYV